MIGIKSADQPLAMDQLLATFLVGLNGEDNRAAMDNTHMVM